MYKTNRAFEPPVRLEIRNKAMPVQFGSTTGSVENRSGLETLPDVLFRRRNLRQVLRSYCRGYDLLPECIYIFDSRLRRLLDVNRAACRALGYSRRALLGESPQIIMPDDAWEAFAGEIRAAREKRYAVTEFESAQKSKRQIVFPVHWRIKFVRKMQVDFILSLSRKKPQSQERELQNAGFSRHYAGTFGIKADSRDISDENSTNISSHPRIFIRPMHDALTGLPDRQLFAHRLERTFSSSRKTGGGFAVLFIDMDHFKLINDTLGHRAGDRALCETGRRLSEAVRSCDLVARYGGDEFTILAGPLCEESEAVLMAERILARLKMPLSIGGSDVSLAASIGIASSWRGDFDAEGMIDRADAAMYRAKAQGGSRFEFHRG
jgi:diguanylate cyclase (GGDEF)-like protein/PAS domain S-box-containing protein